ncbi:unnamed protein product [Musa acuminata subsp. malaccensis]|uniref:(wild Malaysian banana) hypothetical protein n=1 Tax=Musa acuminata subsp. malaccensis TaxID=214687 RepID=A0A804JXN2_MUSAM|nr:PREDICTED: putative clathrin assembly protein At1g25240 [Musa acuminata subsp. malaccensis]CAG1857190.1 unnamed protein product [Musa acuminata subsp. malaccensis]
MTSTRQWWRRATAVAKDKWSICVTRAMGARHLYRRSPEMEAAVIRATSHDERSVDYKNAGRVFAWARAAPSSLLASLMWTVARRASRTRSWPVALKCLLLAHGLILCSHDAPPAARVGRLPFDLSDFHDRYSDSPGFSAFIRAYFRFLDHRSLLPALKGSASASPVSETEEDRDGNGDDDLERLESLQLLLDLLMQIRPYADGMEVELVLEAMDCAVIEIFDVYSGICSGIAHFLVGVLGPDPAKPEATTEAMKRRRAAGMQVLRRARAQSAQLSAYFELCRALGVLNAAELPPVEGIPEQDMDDIERMMLCITQGSDDEAEERNRKTPEGGSMTVTADEWVVFEDENHSVNSILDFPDQISPSKLWAPVEKPGPTVANGNLRDLISL